jgi:hypothetical protein
MRAQLVTPLAISALLFVLTFGAAVARAQDTRGYVGGAGLLSIIKNSHPPGTSPSLPNTGVEGSSFGGAAEAGWFITPSTSISAEASLPARFTSVQETNYFRSWRVENRYRELVLSALVRAHTPRSGPVRFEVVAGPSLIQESSIQRRADETGPLPGSIFPPIFGPYGPEKEITHRRVGVTMGAGVSLRVSSHVSIVPEMRVHWIRRSTGSYDGPSGTFDDLWYLGLSPWVYRPAISIRALF